MENVEDEEDLADAEEENPDKMTPDQLEYWKGIHEAQGKNSDDWNTSEDLEKEWDVM